jgi:hypothetical protein
MKHGAHRRDMIQDRTEKTGNRRDLLLRYESVIIIRSCDVLTRIMSVTLVSSSRMMCRSSLTGVSLKVCPGKTRS